MTLKSSSYLLPKFSRVPLSIVLIPLISTVVNGTLLNFGKRSVAKVALRFGCAKQSKNLGQSHCRFLRPGKSILRSKYLFLNFL